MDVRAKCGRNGDGKGSWGGRLYDDVVGTKARPLNQHIAAATHVILTILHAPPPPIEHPPSFPLSLPPCEVSPGPCTCPPCAAITSSSQRSPLLLNVNLQGSKRYSNIIF